MAFNPSEKKWQHYVPVFWQRRFAGPDGQLWAIKNRRIGVVAASGQMAESWLYTTYDRRWAASNFWESVAGRQENEAAKLFRIIESPPSTGTQEEQINLRYFFAFSACRHPDVMGSGFRRTKELANFIAEIHEMHPEDFAARAATFGLGPEDVPVLISQTRGYSTQELREQAAEVARLTPEDPRLPQQLAIDFETVSRVFMSTRHMTITILDAVPGEFFLLGDTPFPPQLGAGFTLPISSTVALLWKAGAAEDFPDWNRRVATSAEVDHSNRTQAENALRVVVGPSQAALQPYQLI